MKPKCRTPKYLSPSAVQLFYKNRDEYYLKYISPHKPPYLDQTRPMSIGSAFDAYVKAYLGLKLFGKAGAEERGLGQEKLLVDQVESHNLDWARIHGKHVFDQYQYSGALANLLIELGESTTEPVFEGRLTKDVILKDDMVEGVPLLGYPDVSYTTSEGATIIRDWKVNGYCGKAQTSPKKGYLMCRDGWSAASRKHSRSHNQTHKDAWGVKYKGIKINVNHNLEVVDTTWAAQLTIYAWMLGEPIGGDFIVGIEQLCGMGHQGAVDSKVDIRIAAHSCRVGLQYQNELVEQIITVWEACSTGKIFPEDNDENCARLDGAFARAAESGDPKDAWFANINRSQ